MPKQIKKEDGTEETVYTQEELDASTKALKEEHTRTQSELQEQLQAKEKELAGFSDKDFNFKQAREAIDSLKKQIAENQKKHDEEIGKVRTDMSGAALNAAIRGLAGEDADLAKKVEFHFKDTLRNMPSGTPEEFTKRIQNAYLLAAGRNPDPKVLGGAVYGSGGAGPGAGAGGGARSGSGAPVKPEIMEMGRRYFGLTEDDFKKYDKMDFSTTK